MVFSIIVIKSANMNKNQNLCKSDKQKAAKNDNQQHVKSNERIMREGNK